MDSITKRPAGITLLAILSLAVGIIYLLQGVRILGWVVFGPAHAFSQISLTGWWTLILGLIWISVAGALLSLRPWAWLFAVIVVGISLIEAFFGSLNGWDFGDVFVATIIPLLILFYLGSESVMTAFGFGEPTEAIAAPAPAPVAAPAPVVTAAPVVAATVVAAQTPVPEAVAAPVVVPTAAVVEEPHAAHHVNIEDVEGIGPAYGEKLAVIGIKTTDDLLAAGAKPNDREKIAEQTGISGTLILGWVNKVDLMRVPGVGPQYSDLLEAAGVDSPAELSHRNPANLAATVQSVVAERPGIVRRVPTEAEVTGWIDEAGRLGKVVEH